MYEYLKGTITVMTPNYIVIDVNGVGYRVAVANPYSFTEGEQAKVYVEQIVKEDSQALYGFLNSEEKLLFEKLLGVSGIGPKSALAIMANPDHQALVDAIRDNNVTYLSKFPGIGKKTASRIVVDLQDKVDTLFQGEIKLDFAPTALPASENQALSDALAALEALGYKERDVKKVAKELAKEADWTTDQYLRQGLRLLN